MINVQTDQQQHPLTDQQQIILPNAIEQQQPGEQQPGEQLQSSQHQLSLGSCRNNLGVALNNVALPDDVQIPNTGSRIYRGYSGYP